MTAAPATWKEHPMRVRLRVLVPAPEFGFAGPAQVSVACGSSVTGWLAPASKIPPTACGRCASRD
jgi:hypothetical protein